MHAYGENLLLCTFKHPELGDTVAHHTRESACARLLRRWANAQAEEERRREVRSLAPSTSLFPPLELHPPSISLFNA